MPITRKHSKNTKVTIKPVVTDTIKNTPIPDRQTISGVTEYLTIQQGFRGVLDEAHRMVDFGVSTPEMIVKLGGLAVFYKNDSDNMREFVNKLMNTNEDVKKAVLGASYQTTKIGEKSTVVSINL